MNMQQVQILGLGHGTHFGRQGQGVGLMLEEWIRHHFDFVKMDAFI